MTSGAPSPDPSAARPPPDEREGFIALLKDNLEAIAVAVIMALVIKHFCVEAFKIPTSSMVPTLRGDGDTPGHPDIKGDRILVDKFAYLMEEPRRWDVIVFRYPLDRSRNFIKRIAGLPGERLRISRDGDLWVRPSGDDGTEADLRIPQKPPRVRGQFYRPVYPPPAPPASRDGDDGPPAGSENIERYWRVREGPPNAWRLERHDLYTFRGGARAVLRAAPPIRDLSRPDSWGLSGNAGTSVRDVRVRLRLRTRPPPTAATSEGAEAIATRVALTWQPDGEFRAVLALSSVAGESRAFLRRGTAIIQEADVGVVLEAGASHEVELEYVDGMLRAHVDGKERAALPDGRRFTDTWSQESDQELTLSAEGALDIESMHIDRDLCYVNEWSGNPAGEQRGVDVPEDSYFMLGDNTHNSSDSRRWQLVTVHLGDGSTHRYDKSKGVDYLHDEADGATRKRVIDADGIVRTWADDDEHGTKGSSTAAAPFVHRDLVIGRAFLRFWPCTPDFPGRLGFIH